MIMPIVNMIKPVAEVKDLETPSNNTEVNTTFSELLMQFSAGVNFPKSNTVALKIQTDGIAAEAVGVDGKNISSKGNLSNIGNIVVAGTGVEKSLSEQAAGKNVVKADSKGIIPALVPEIYTDEMLDGKIDTTKPQKHNIETNTSNNNKGIQQTQQSQPYHNNDLVLVSKFSQYSRGGQFAQSTISANEPQMNFDFSTINNYQNLSQAVKTDIPVGIAGNLPLVAATIKQPMPTGKTEVEFQTETSDTDNAGNLNTAEKSEMNSISKFRFASSLLPNSKFEKQQVETVSNKTEIANKSKNDQQAGDNIIPPQAVSSSSESVAVKANVFNSVTLESQINAHPSTKKVGATPQVPLSSITQQDADNIIKNIVLNFKNEVSEMKMKLHPESLGEMSLKVRMEEGKTTVKIEVTQTAVKTIIETNLPQLRESLIARGVDVQQIDVFTSGNLAANSNHKKQNESQNNPASYAPQTEEAEESVKMFGYNTVEYLI